MLHHPFSSGFPAQVSHIIVKHLPGIWGAVFLLYLPGINRPLHTAEQRTYILLYHQNPTKARTQPHSSAHLSRFKSLIVTCLPPCSSSR